MTANKNDAAVVDKQYLEDFLKFNSTSFKSIGNFISTLMIILVILASIFAGTVLYRVLDVQNIIEDITDNSLPEVIFARNMQDQVYGLINLTDELTHIVYVSQLTNFRREIDSRILNLKSLSSNQKKSTETIIDLDVIANELHGLTDLVHSSFLKKSTIANDFNHLATLHNELFELCRTHQKHNKTNELYIAWLFNFLEVVDLSKQTMGENNLIKMHKQLDIISIKMNLLFLEMTDLPNDLKVKTKKLIINLWSETLGDEGILPMKLQQLRIEREIISKSKFITNLAKEYSRHTEFNSYKVVELVLDQANDLDKRIINESRLLIVLMVIFFIAFLTLLYFIRKQLIIRLKRLNEGIVNNLEGAQEKLPVAGNDEITSISQAFNIFIDKIQHQHKALKELSLIDSLTGLANRRALDQRLEHDLLMATRNQNLLSVMIIDVDFFKQYNDTYGHLAGDENLKLIGNALVHCNQRTTDFAARYGGDEFLLILPGTDLSGAQKVAEKITAEVKRLNIIHESSEIESHVTLSIGFACTEHNVNLMPDELIAKADLALYEVKENGRNGYFPMA